MQDEAVGLNECLSCNGMNTSCPDGCERDPLTGELIPWACPGCAAKDEAMEAGQFLLDRLDALEWLDGQLEDTARDYMGHVEPAIERFRATLSRFIIPPADPVAEALKAAIHAYGGELIEGENFDMAVAELKSRLPLGGAK